MNSKRTQHRFNPSSRDWLILKHVVRYRLTTLASLKKTVLPKSSRNALNKATNRLCAAGLLRKYTLLHPTKYFVLGESGARWLGVGEHRSTSLGPQSLPQEFALLAFATLGTKVHLRLTTAEVQERCSWLPSSLAGAPHCLDQANVLELIRVDLGGPADHVARKCAADMRNRCRIREFPPLVAARQFRLVVVTATTGKANAIQRALDHHYFPAGLLFHFSVVPQLLLIGARENHA